MPAAKLLVVLLAAGAAAFIAWTIVELFVPWWNRRTDRYVKWMIAEQARMYQPMTETDARRLLGIATFAPAALALVAGSPVGALLLGAIGAAAPYGLVRYRDWNRRRTLDNQLIDALILMANGLKAGLSLFQAVELAADELKAPIADEFGRLLKDLRLGRLIDEALLEMADRLELPDLEIAVHSIVTLRESGGNLSETFFTVAHTIVERKKVEGKIQSLTAQGVYQGVGMCAMPFLLAAIFYLMDPEYMRPMFHTWLGWAIWAVVIVLDSLGMWAIVKIVTIDV